MERKIDPIAKKGMRIHLISMDTNDPNPIDSGLEGTIYKIDSLGTLHVKWDDGRILGVIPNKDKYQLLPPEEEQISPNEFIGLFDESNNPKPILRGSKSTPAGKKVTKNWKSALSKNRPSPKIKIESEEEINEFGKKITEFSKKKKEDLKNSWESFVTLAKREKKETIEAVKVLRNLLKDKNSVNKEDLDLLKGQSKDLAKIVAVMGMGAVSMVIPLTLEKILNKYNISIMPKEQIKGGKAEGMTIQDISKKHKVDIKNIEKELKVGTKIEMEHTDSKVKAKEIAMDHITEFPDYYTNPKHGTIASEKGLEKDLEETTTSGSAGAYNAPLFGKQTNVRKPKAKKLASKIVTKGDLKNPLGKIYSISPKTESKRFKVGDFLSEIASTHAAKLRAAEGTFDGDPWVGKKGWLRKDELTWPGGEISDILAKMDIDWGDSDLTLSDMQTDKINEGWLIKSKEDKLVLSILKRVKERYPDNVKLERGYGGENDLPDWGNPIIFTLPGIKREAKINVKCYNVPYQGGTACSLQVNYKDLDASKWAIKKLYNFFFEKIHDETKLKLDREIESDLTDPGYAEDVFDMLDDEDVMSEGKKKKEKESPIHKKKWERCVKDVKKQNKKDGKDYNPYAVCTASIGYEGSIKKPHRRKDKEEIEETTTFSSVFGGGFPVTPFMFAKKGKHIPSKKPIWKGGKIVQKTNKADLLGESLIDEINKIKWVKGGKFVKIKDKCAKYNNQPHCSQGAIDDPLELSDTAFESVKKVSKKTGIKEGEILDRIKAKLKGVTPEQMEYNKEHGLPIWWQGSKEGFYEKMEPRKNNTGSN